MDHKNQWISLLAYEGIINLAAKTVELKNNVDLFTYDGLEVHGTNIFLSLFEGSAHSANPLQIMHPQFMIEAKGFMVEESGDIIHLDGPVRIIAYPSETK